MALSDYSTTAASNTTIASIDVSGTTGLVKNGDNVMRAIAADLKAGVITGYTTTATAAGTTTLTVASNSYQYFTGTSAQTITMPVVTTLELGRTWVFVNNSTGALTVNSSGANLIATVGPSCVLVVTCILLTGTSAASWSAPNPLNFTSTAPGTLATLTSTDAGSAAGPSLSLFRNSASPAAVDIIGSVLFDGKDSAGNTETYASIEGRIVDATSTSEDGTIFLKADLAGTLTSYLNIGASTNGVGTANVIGLPLGQLGFPATQNASSDANTLDDYEEGTTSPVPTAATGTITTASSTLFYTKVGRQVTVTGDVVVTTNGTGATNLRVTAPFTSGSTAGNQAIGTWWNRTDGNVCGRITLGNNSATMTMLTFTGTYPVTLDGKTYSITLTYFVDA